MDVLKVARKLEPLMPQDVKHWIRIRDVADPDLKSLIDKQIFLNAYEKLGDFRNKILLSLPNKQKAKGEFHLGTIIYEQEKWSVGLSKTELLQNLAIFGRSGAGKTNVAFHLLQQLIDKNIPFLFLDWKRTARHLIPLIKKKINVYTPGRKLSPFMFNPFIPPIDLEKHLYINQVVDVLSRAYTLGDGSKSILQKVLIQCYQQKNWPTAQDVLQALENLETKGRSHGWKTSAIRALQSLCFSEVTDNNEITQEQLFKNLIQGNNIIDI